MSIHRPQCSNLTFNFNKFDDYLRETAKINHLGDKSNDLIVQHIDYITNPSIKMKNFTIVSEILQNLN